VRSSRLAGELQQIDTVLVPAPQSRADKIAQLRRAVQSGVYSVSAEQIAAQMVRAALEDMLA
jgi:anti-sigma28 factor (negative regulator of flagellin synthesis)